MFLSISNLMMKIKQKKIFLITIISCYFFALFPFFTPSENNYLDLSAAIQQIQKVQQSSFSNQNYFQTALRGSILSLRSIAGISAVIVKTSPKSATTDTDSSFVLVLVKLPHILSTTGYQTMKISNFHDGLLMVNNIYKSLTFPPELPPPIFS